MTIETEKWDSRSGFLVLDWINCQLKIDVCINFFSFKDFVVYKLMFFVNVVKFQIFELLTSLVDARFLFNFLFNFDFILRLNFFILSLHHAIRRVKLLNFLFKHESSHVLITLEIPCHLTVLHKNCTHLIVTFCEKS